MTVNDLRNALARYLKIAEMMAFLTSTPQDDVAIHAFRCLLANDHLLHGLTEELENTQ